jgi:CcmD family protein
MTGPVRRVVAAALCALWAGVSLCAQQQTTQFVPLDQARQPEMASAPLLYGAYAFVWAALVVYLFTIWRRVGRVERELRDVSGRLAARR